MKVEKHNSHGMQLLVKLTPIEAFSLAVKIIETAQQTNDKGVNHYVSLPCMFEDDNDLWVKTSFDVVVDGGSTAECKPTYPCGKEIVRGVVDSALFRQPLYCGLAENHEGGCYPS